MQKRVDKIGHMPVRVIDYRVTFPMYNIDFFNSGKAAGYVEETNESYVKNVSLSSSTYLSKCAMHFRWEATVLTRTYTYNPATFDLKDISRR